MKDIYIWDLNHGNWLKSHWEEWAGIPCGGEFNDHMRQLGWFLSDTYPSHAREGDRSELYRREDSDALLFWLEAGDLGFWIRPVTPQDLLQCVGMARDMHGGSEQGKLIEIATKAFHAWHGHYSYKPCYECDPTEARRIDYENRMWREEQRAKKESA